MIRVLVVDDSAVIRTLLKRSLAKDPRIEIVGEAYDGQGAIEQNRLLKPDVITMDIYMPVMDGIEATKRIMQEQPAAIMIFSTEDSARMGYAALEAGAVDMLKKPDLTHFSPDFYRSFIERIVAVTERGRKSPVFAKRAGGFSPFAKPASSVPVRHEAPTLPSSAGGRLHVGTAAKTSPAVQPGTLARSSVTPATATGTHAYSTYVTPAAAGSKDLLVIGASTGGPVAVQNVLAKIGRDFPYPILITQHIDSAFDKHYASWLADTTGMDVTLAQNNGVVVPGTVYIAPANYHLVVSRRTPAGYVTALVDEPPVNYLRPAVDYLFTSAAKVAGSRCIAVLLTGMGRDGANGCVDIYKSGGYTIAEAEETCVVFGMPKAAIDLGAASSVLPVYEIAPYVRRIAGLN
ncbi:MAG: chemotaxis-specific protein-glutamate methyltransferase CheB [Spirochaetaceae bacterium]|nr:chemotaxis-specific protein-glutamate methyltransferase CheB [Spirochaetaceae bacterium]